MWFVHKFDPVILSLGPLEVRYYGLVWVITFFFAYYFLKKYKDEINVETKDIENLLTLLIISVVIGARIFAVFVWDFSYYSQNLIEIFKVWKGGLSFHGGFLAAVLVGLYWCRKHKVKVLRLADLFTIPITLGLFLGRIANFTNGELWGRPTNVFWCVKFSNTDPEGLCRHPSQLYASFKNLVMFTILNILNYKRTKLKKVHGMFKYKDGYLFGLFFIMYGVFRFIVEFWRYTDPKQYVGIFTMGQFLNIFMLIAGAGIIYYVYKYK